MTPTHFRAIFSFVLVITSLAGSSLRAECTTQDAKPLLQEKAYRPTEYKRSLLKKNPLTLLETLTLENGTRLDIAQRGCTDIIVDFDFAFKSKTSASGETHIDEAARLLKSLKLSSETILGKERILELVDKILANKGKSEICLSFVDGECITDVLVRTSEKSVSLHYLDRP